jgi:hypothetical protein
MKKLSATHANDEMNDHSQAVRDRRENPGLPCSVHGPITDMEKGNMNETTPVIIAQARIFSGDSQNPELRKRHS